MTFFLKPHLSADDMQLFEKYVSRASVYFEFGSGGSTDFVNSHDNIKHIYSVESDHEWYNKVKEVVGHDKTTYLFSNLNTKPRMWGYPGPGCTDDQCRAYSDRLSKLHPSKRGLIDLVFIDGRFRVACCLKCFDSVSDDCVVCFDDFLNRPSYHVVLDYFDIIDKSESNRMVILRKKAGVRIPEEVIKQYELVSG